MMRPNMRMQLTAAGNTNVDRVLSWRPRQLMR